MLGSRVTEEHGRHPAANGLARVDSVDLAEAYRELAPPVLAYLRLQLAADAEDLLGEVFAQVVRDIDQFDGDLDELRRWVFTIAHHRVIDHFRRLRRRPWLVPLVEERDDRDAVDASAVAVDPALVDALAQLTDDQRTVVVLRFVADLRLDDVAVVMRRSVDAVKALQHRALTKLAASLEVPA